MSISHKSTAKSILRNLIAVHGKSGALALFTEVLSESLPARRGRPTRDEAVTRFIVGAMSAIIPEIVAGEEKIANPLRLEEE